MSHNVRYSGPRGPRSASKLICPRTSRVLAVIEAKTTPGCSFAKNKDFKCFRLFSSWAEAEDDALEVELLRFDVEEEEAFQETSVEIEDLMLGGDGRGDSTDNERYVLIG